MTAQSHASPPPRFGAALLAAVVRSQAPAAATTALFRNQQLITPRHTTMTTAHDASHDFDFLHGHWHVANRRLKRRLVGCDDWETFEAVGECRPILGGVGNIDSFDTAWGGGYRGMALRLFDRRTQRWSIYWASDRDGVLEPPVTGRFDNGAGHFEGDDVHAGTPVRARFLWTGITPTTAHWEQAFSVDDGRTWETNWHMRMTRR
ncbi:MAG: hypothetical protein WBV39_12985, partial [Rudaea sp.]